MQASTLSPYSPTCRHFSHPALLSTLMFGGLAAAGLFNYYQIDRGTSSCNNMYSNGTWAYDCYDATCGEKIVEVCKQQLNNIQYLTGWTGSITGLFSLIPIFYVNPATYALAKKIKSMLNSEIEGEIVFIKRDNCDKLMSCGIWSSRLLGVTSIGIVTLCQMVALSQKSSFAFTETSRALNQLDNCLDPTQRCVTNTTSLKDVVWEKSISATDMNTTIKITGIIAAAFFALALRTYSLSRYTQKYKIDAINYKNSLPETETSKAKTSAPAEAKEAQLDAKQVTVHVE